MWGEGGGQCSYQSNISWKIEPNMPVQLLWSCKSWRYYQWWQLMLTWTVTCNSPNKVQKYYSSHMMKSMSWSLCGLPRDEVYVDSHVIKCMWTLRWWGLCGFKHDEVYVGSQMVKSSWTPSYWSLCGLSHCEVMKSMWTPTWLSLCGYPHRQIFMESHVVKSL